MYLWCKWLHVVAVISWMAGILYLYRLLIYHCERGSSSQDNHHLLSLMERRLYRYITIPAMIVAAFAGLGMISIEPTLLSTGWLPVKLFFVVFLIFSTLWAGKLVKVAESDPKQLPTSKALRIANEVPTILMMVIVALVIFKSF
jgi:putative membrane protein